MFSIRPRMGTSTFRNMDTPLIASARATSWGVVTMTTPVRLKLWARLRLASPVPGGKSTTR